MRKTTTMYVWAALAALGLATACKREAIDFSLPDTAEVPMGMVCVQVETTDAPDILTKVDGNAAQSQNERKVNSMQVFVFKKNGKFYAAYLISDCRDSSDRNSCKVTKAFNTKGEAELAAMKCSVFPFLECPDGRARPAYLLPVTAVTARETASATSEASSRATSRTKA